ncbi:MAG TPA: PAS-domain containing protein [Microvirga sp.]|nr:PAS-domain containing protein [Microvirga sp.]
MLNPPRPPDEEDRLRALEHYRLRDISREPAFDRLASMAADIVGTSIGLVTIIEADAQCFAGASGMEVANTPRSEAFCAFTILTDQIMVVPDALLDPRFCDHPAVIGAPFIRFYAGAPLKVAGRRIGSLCVVDTHPRNLTEDDERRLKSFAELGNTLIESRLERLLKTESEERLGNLIEAMPVALAVYDSQDRLMNANALYAQTFFASDPGDLPIGASLREVLDRMEASGLSVRIDGGEGDWKQQRIELRRRGVQTYEMWLSTGRSLVCHEVRMANGDLVAAFTDVTQLKERENALTEQSALLRDTLESIDQGIAVFSEDRRMIACSESYFDLLDIPDELRHLGISFEEVVQDLAHRGYFGEGDPEKISKTVLMSVNKGRSRRSEIETPDGRTLAFGRSVAEDGRIIVTCLDVTARKEVERLKDEFVSTVSHELRTPLTSITGSLGLMQGGAAGELPPRAARLVDIAYKNVQRLTKLVNELLDIDKIEAGQIEFKRERVDLNSIAEQVLEHNRPYADRFGVLLDVQASPEPTYVIGDSDRLLQVATNLLSNAVKHSPPGATVTVSTQLKGGHARLSVTDRGPGIPEHFQARIFRRFAQADSSDRRAQEGTGLGLAISRAIVERHGGSIGFETQQNVGTTFYVDLPLGNQKYVPPQLEGAPRILICEDNSQVGRAMLRVLQQSGAEVDLVGTMKSAFAHLAEKRYQVLIVDLLLPDGNGLDLIREVRSRPDLQDIRILVVSAIADKTRRSLEAGALNVLDWLNKPVDGARLAEAVARVSAAKPPHRIRVLHVEDEPDLRQVVSLALTDFADVEFAVDLASARTLLASGSYDAVILDMALPDGSGSELVPDITDREGHPLPVVIFSAGEANGDAVKGVYRALTKSRSSIEDLANAVRKMVEEAHERSSE